MSGTAANKRQRKAAALLLGLAAALIAIEVLVRAAGAARRFSDARACGRAVRQEADLRLMCLGESTTGSQYPRLLGPMLSRALPGLSVSVIDRGVTGVNSSYILDHVGAFLDSGRPQIVTAMMGCNDGEQILAYGDIRSPLLYRWMRRCRTLGLLRFLLWNLRDMHRAAGSEPAPMAGIERGAPPGPDEFFFERLPALDRARALAGNESAAFAAFEAALQRRDARLQLCLLYHSYGMYRQARAMLEPMAVMPEADSTALSLLVPARLNTEDRAGAEAALEAALGGEGPRRAVDFLVLGHHLTDFNRYAEAEELLIRGMRLYPERPELALKLISLVYMRNGRTDDALRCARTALERFPSNLRLRKVADMLDPESAGALTTAFNSERTRRNYRRLARLLSGRGVKLVAVQYPMQKLYPLRDMLAGCAGVFFVDNEESFRRAVAARGYAHYFSDSFGGDFGHCTRAGNELIAENISRVVVEDLLDGQARG